MKVFTLFLATLTLCANNATFLVSRENNHYTEDESRYIWVSDGEGDPKLGDLHTSVDIQELTRARNEDENQYFLFTRNNPTSRQVLIHGNINSVLSSTYNGSRPTKVIVHGWNNNGSTEMNPLITSAFLAIADVNVIVVDWNRLANGLYTTAVNGVPSVGQHLGNFLIWLFAGAGGDWNELHLVGFSLGAHVVGNAGRQVSGRAARVTGLDPAGPQWGNNSLALSRSSGQYVESIHTDSRLFGIVDPVSHADFYPNGGRNPQPGCFINTCSHRRSTQLFASSIRTNHFVGRQCISLSEAQLATCNGSHLHMGNSMITKRGAGLFGLITESNWPF